MRTLPPPKRSRFDDSRPAPDNPDCFQAVVNSGPLGVIMQELNPFGNAGIHIRHPGPKPCGSPQNPLGVTLEPFSGEMTQHDLNEKISKIHGSFIAPPDPGACQDGPAAYLTPAADDNLTQELIRQNEITRWISPSGCGTVGKLRLVSKKWCQEIDSKEFPQCAIEALIALMEHAMGHLKECGRIPDAIQCEPEKWPLPVKQAIENPRVDAEYKGYVWHDDSFDDDEDFAGQTRNALLLPAARVARYWYMAFVALVTYFGNHGARLQQVKTKYWQTFAADPSPQTLVKKFTGVGICQIIDSHSL